MCPVLYVNSISIKPEGKGNKLGRKTWTEGLDSRRKCQVWMWPVGGPALQGAELTHQAPGGPRVLSQATEADRRIPQSAEERGRSGTPDMLSREKNRCVGGTAGKGRGHRDKEPRATETV